MKDKITSFSAVGTSILSSACCTLPIIAVTFGFGIGGAAVFFEKFRFYLLGISFLLLGFSFYSIYFKNSKAACDTGACAVTGSSKLTRIILWITTVLVILIGFFPDYSIYIL